MSAGHIRARGANAFELKYDLGADPITGKRRVRYETVHGSKRDAQRRLRELLGQVDRGVVADAGKMTTGDWLVQWLAECQHMVSPKTHQERAASVHRHLIPALGAIPLAKLGVVHIQAHYTAALTSGRLDGKGGLAAQTVRHHDRILHVALGRARQLRLIATNPVEDTKAPRVEHTEPETLDAAGQAQLLAAAAGTALYIPISLTLASGLRRGEVLALAWSHVDLEAGVLHVDITFHGLRHTHVSDLLRAGVHPKVVSERVGHSSIAFTLGRYAHTSLDMHQGAAQQMDAALRRALGWQSGGNGSANAG